jgi:hypothetical protein
MMGTWFDFDQVSIDFLFESRLPSSQIWIFPIEDEIIPFIQYTPGTNHENLHEKGLQKSFFSNIKLLMNADIFFPSNSQCKPSTNYRRALKK